MRPLAFVAALGLLAASSCSKKTPPEPASESRSQLENPHGAGSSAPAAPTGGSGVTWTAPPAWKSVPPSSAMRKATYRIPPAGHDTEGAELAVFYFGVDQGGSVDANMERWVGQFQGATLAKADRGERKVNGMTQWTIEVGGTYTGSGMPGAPPGAAKPEQRLLGAIVESPSGKYFFKMTGPRETVIAAREGFFQLLDSIKGG